MTWQELEQWKWAAVIFALATMITVWGLLLILLWTWYP